LLEAKRELKIAKKDIAELTEQNKKLAIEMENRQQIDSAIEYLRQSNQKVTNRCAELEAELQRHSFEAGDMETLLKRSEKQNKALRDEIAELKVEIDRIRYNASDLNNSQLLNMSTLSVNQQVVSEMETKILRLESENVLLKASQEGLINAKLLEQEQELLEARLELKRFQQATERLEKAVTQLTAEKESLITQKLETESKSNS